ncbi:hypothetical protein D3C81_2014880 [compost metagenome]
MLGHQPLCLADTAERIELGVGQGEGLRHVENLRVGCAGTLLPLRLAIAVEPAPEAGHLQEGIALLRVEDVRQHPGKYPWVVIAQQAGLPAHLHAQQSLQCLAEVFKGLRGHQQQ